MCRYGFHTSEAWRRPNMTSSFENPNMNESFLSMTRDMNLVGDRFGQPGHELEATETSSEDDDVCGHGGQGNSPFLRLPRPGRMSGRHRRAAHRVSRMPLKYFAPGPGVGWAGDATAVGTHTTVTGASGEPVNLTRLRSARDGYEGPRWRRRCGLLGWRPPAVWSGGAGGVVRWRRRCGPVAPAVWSGRRRLVQVARRCAGRWCGALFLGPWESGWSPLGGAGAAGGV